MRVYNPAIEGLSRAEMLDLQWRKLTYQLSWMHERNGFYRRWLDDAGVDVGAISSIEAFRELVPISGKTDLLADQEDEPPFGRRLGVRPDQVVQTFLTSGTSGVGQEVYGHTWRDALLSGTKYLEAPLWWMGLRKGDRIFSMVPIATLAFGLMTAETFRLAGYQAYQVFNMEATARLALMKRMSVEAVVITPAHLARLTTICREEGIDPRRDFPHLKGLLVAGQSYPVELAQRLEEIWGTSIFETYGSSQGNGHIAATNEEGALREDGSRGAMLVYDHHLLVEVLDPETWDHVEPGEEGMAVLTNLEVEGSPLLRFRTDDKVRYLGDESDDGRPFSMIEAGTISRYDDMLKIRGMNVWPQAVDDTVFSHEEIDEYVAEVSVDDDGREQVDLRFGLRAGAVDTMGDVARDALVGQLVSEIKDKTNVTFRVREVPRAELPVFEFKAVRWSDTRQSDLEKKVW